jgi:hypothetical protein
VGASGTAGLLLTTQAYDALTDAPTSGYNDSLPLLIKGGTVFFVQSLSFNCTTQALLGRRYIYSKIIVDSINYSAYDPNSAPAGRTLYYRMVVDPNCGFISLEPGLPTH